MTVPAVSQSVLDKSVGEMIGDDVKVMDNGYVVGTMKYVEDFKEFSSNPSEQNGYYFPLVLTNTGTKCTIKKDGEISKDNVDFPEDKTFVFIVEGNTQTIEILVDGDSVVKLNFATATFAEHE